MTTEEPMSTTIAAIRLGIRTSAAPARAWAFITEPDRVARWFAETTPVGEPGSPYLIDFGDGSVVEGRILAMEPGRSFEHEWAWRDDEPGRPTIVRWEVSAEADGGARIDLVHDGWTEAGADDALRDDHEAYWSGYLDDLRDLLAEANDEPAG